MVTGDMRGEIYYWFVVAQTPQGGAPLEIREQWNGVALPVRRPRPVEAPVPLVGREIGRETVRNFIDDGVPVLAADALRALDLFGRHEALAWWREWFAGRAISPTLAFRTHEGRLVPPSLALRLYPELDGFD